MMGGIIDFITGGGGDDASDAAIEASQIQAQWQTDALEYLKEREEIPSQLRDQALTQLGGFYGLGGGGAPGVAPGDTVAPPPGGGTPPAPPPGGTDVMQRRAELQTQLADLQWQNSNMSETMRDNQGLHSTTAIEKELEAINAHLTGMPLPPSPDPMYPGSAPTDPTTHQGYTPYSWMSGAPGAPGAGGVDTMNQVGGVVDPVTGVVTDAVTGAAGEDGDGFGGMQAFIERAMESPLYTQIMGGQELGEEAIMRQAGATGGLRSGNVQGNMYDYTTQLQNQALLSSYNEQLAGLQGMAGLPSNANQIANQMGSIGSTYAQGQIGAAQSQQTGQQNWMNNLMGLGQLGTSMYGAGMFSDVRLKKNIKKIGQINGHNFYSWDWNSIANNLGLTGSTCGCMAHEVYDKNKDAVFLKDSFLFVNYSTIGVL